MKLSTSKEKGIFKPWYVLAIQCQALYARWLSSNGGEAAVFMQQRLLAKELPAAECAHVLVSFIAITLRNHYFATPDDVKLVSTIALSDHWCAGREKFLQRTPRYRDTR